jgi:hypothetical protein
MNATTQRFYQALQQHPLRQIPLSNSSALIELDQIPTQLAKYRLDHDALIVGCDYELLSALIPAFYCRRTPWSEDRKSSFMENLFADAAIPEIKVYAVEADGDASDHIFILDGFERLKSLTDFKNNRIKIFGDITYDDVKAPRINRLGRVRLAFHQFANHVEACRYYININRHITHSEHDLQPAYDFLAAAAKG